MQPYLTPTCYFPSTVVFIDDSREFLMNFTLQLDESLAYRIFDSPYNALDAIYAKQKSADYLSQRCMSEYLETHLWPATNQTVNLDLAAIHSEAYNPQRFSEISVVVVDYAMPGMNGLEFCERMENSSIKRILLTGQADERTAIEAFNQGIIHRFVQKNDPNVTQNIMTAILQLQQEYFLNMSQMVTNLIAIDSPSCLADRKFSAFFQELCQTHNTVEFYLTEASGSFLLLDDFANPSCLIMKNDQDLQMHYDLALDNKAPQKILDQLQSGEKIPCFWQADGMQSEWTDWATCLIPAKKLECDETYYYAYVKDHLGLDIRRDKILSYHDYLEKTDMGMLSSL